MSGLEWIVEAHGCNPTALTDQRSLETLFGALVGELNLHPLGKTNWHKFPHTGGITGVSLLAESHIACHTFPEYGSLCLNIFCCRRRAGTCGKSSGPTSHERTRCELPQLRRPGEISMVERDTNHVRILPLDPGAYRRRSGKGRPSGGLAPRRIPDSNRNRGDLRKKEFRSDRPHYLRLRPRRLERMVRGLQRQQ